MMVMKKLLLWAVMVAFLFPVYGYADGTAVPEFKDAGECNAWVRNYASTINVKTHYDSDARDWFSSFAVSDLATTKNCSNTNCTMWYSAYEGDQWGPGGPRGGGCSVLGGPMIVGEYPLLEDVWAIAKRDLVDMIAIYESRSTLLPEFRYGKVCRYQSGTDPQQGDCQILLYDPAQPCATYNPATRRLHIPCLNDGGNLYWKEAVFIEPWVFEVSNQGRGFEVPGHRDDCATYTASTGIIHIPCAYLGETAYWADFQVTDTSPVRLVLVAAGRN